MGRNSKFFVSHDGVNMGPFEMDIIHQKVAKAELRESDFIYDETGDKWVPMAEYPPYKEFSTSNKKAYAVESLPEDAEMARHTGKVDSSSHSSCWYVLKGKNRYGPFSQPDVIRMLQEKSVFEFDFIWRQGMDGWKRIAEVDEFHPERMISLMKSLGSSDDAQIFFRRRHKRFSYECSVVAHDNSHVWKGNTVEISEGGAGVVMENATLMPGQNVYMHFKPGQNSKPFNVLCEVVSKRYVRGIKEKTTPIVYGVKFINIHKQDRDEIKMIQVAV